MPETPTQGEEQELLDRVHAYVARADPVQRKAFVSRLNGTLRDAYSVQARKDAAKLHVGQRVSFVARGRRMTGTIEKINQKTVSLADCDDGQRWRVPPGSCTPVEP